MPIGLMDFPLLTPEQANPRRTSMMKNIEALLNASSARYNFARSAEQEAKNPYVGDTAKADLAKKILENKYYGKNIESEINLRGATASHYGTEDKVSNYKLDHGGYDPELKQTIDYIRSLKNNNSDSSNKSDSVNRTYDEVTRMNNENQSEQTMPRVDLQKPSIEIPKMSDRINEILYKSLVPDELNAQKTPELPDFNDQRYSRPQARQYPADQQQPQQQRQPQQQQSQQQEEMIPGTNIPLREAMEAVIKHKLGIATNDPARQKYLDGMLELSQKRERASAFRSLPPRAREAEISVVGPMVGGYTNAARALMEGKTPEEIAASKGFDPKDRATWPTPAPPPSQPVVTQQQKANIARNAREAIQQRVGENLGFYPEKILGYSPQMIGDLLQGKNAKQAGKTLAAVFMNNEENALMARGMGVQAGLGMIKMMNTKSLNDLGVPGWLQSKELLDSFREEVRNYNNIMIGNENSTLNAMYRMENPIAHEGNNQQSNASSSVDDQLAEVNRQIAEEEARQGAGG